MTDFDFYEPISYKTDNDGNEYLERKYNLYFTQLTLQTKMERLERKLNHIKFWTYLFLLLCIVSLI
ncbi:UNVERIFIED_CONTAM: hypothetical protein BEN50_11070 [Euhalothece sp. KZN 001]